MIATTSPLVLTWFPARSAARDLLLALAGSLLIALSAQLRIPLPFSPVPVTGQTFGVILAGAALGAPLGALSVLLYWVEGSLGLPFFAGGTSGLATWAGPSAGYLVGFLPAAALAGASATRGWDRKFWPATAMFALAQAVIFVPGLIWLARFVPREQLLIAGLWPFLPGALIKTLAASGATPLAWRFTRRR